MKKPLTETNFQKELSRVAEDTYDFRGVIADKILGDFSKSIERTMNEIMSSTSLDAYAKIHILDVLREQAPKGYSF